MNTNSVVRPLSSTLIASQTSPASSASKYYNTVQDGLSTAPRSIGPAATVELSERAKYLIKSNQTAQHVAEELHLSLSDNYKTTDKKDFRSINTIKYDTDSVYSLLKTSLETNNNVSVQWENPAPYGDPTKTAQDYLNEMYDVNAYIWDDLGYPPEVGQSFRDAMANGTVKVQRASEVDGLNFKSSQTFVPNPNNGVGYDTYGGTTQNPTGDIKKAIDSGRAYAAWSADLGDIYVSW